MAAGRHLLSYDIHDVLSVVNPSSCFVAKNGADIAKGASFAGDGSSASGRLIAGNLVTKIGATPIQPSDQISFAS